MAKFSNLAIEYFMKYIFNNLKVLNKSAGTKEGPDGTHTQWENGSDRASVVGQLRGNATDWDWGRGKKRTRN